MVTELIADHDQVGLPGVGTFVAEVVPATFSDKGYTINPPYRRLSFHPSRTEDRLLTDFYAASNGISKEAAETYLGQFLQELKTVLKESKTIVLPGLGRLRATVENNFFFVADADLDIFPDGFALQSLSLRTISVSGASEPGPSAEPASEPEQAAEADDADDAAGDEAATSEAEPTAAAEPVSIPETGPEAAAEQMPEAEAAFEAGCEAAAADAPEPRRRLRWWIPLLVLLVIAAVALLAFIIVSQVAPDIVDTILYSPEELRIINY